MTYILIMIICLVLGFVVLWQRERLSKMLDLWSKRLLSSSSPYKKEQVIFESSTAGTYEVELLAKGKYEVYVIAAGGGGSYQYTSLKGDNTYWYAGGGSGSGYIGVLKLSKGIFSVMVGAGGYGINAGRNGSTQYAGGGGNSSIGDFVVAYGGGGGRTHSSAGGSGGATPSVNVEQISTTLNKAGNGASNVKNGTSSNGTSYGGGSVYNGYGAGGNSGSSGASGYVKIVYKG